MCIVRAMGLSLTNNYRAKGEFKVEESFTWVF